MALHGITFLLKCLQRNLFSLSRNILLCVFILAGCYESELRNLYLLFEFAKVKCSYGILIRLLFNKAQVFILLSYLKHRQLSYSTNIWIISSSINLCIRKCVNHPFSMSVSSRHSYVYYLVILNIDRLLFHRYLNTILISTSLVYESVWLMYFFSHFVSRFCSEALFITTEKIWYLTNCCVEVEAVTGKDSQLCILNLVLLTTSCLSTCMYFIESLIVKVYAYLLLRCT